MVYRRLVWSYVYRAPNVHEFRLIFLVQYPSEYRGVECPVRHVTDNQTTMH